MPTTSHRRGPTHSLGLPVSRSHLHTRIQPVSMVSAPPLAAVGAGRVTRPRRLCHRNRRAAVTGPSGARPVASSAILLCPASALAGYIPYSILERSLPPRLMWRLGGERRRARRGAPQRERCATRPSGFSGELRSGWGAAVGRCRRGGEGRVDMGEGQADRWDDEVVVIDGKWDGAGDGE